MTNDTFGGKMLKGDFEKTYHLSKHRQFFRCFLERVPEDLASYLQLKRFQPGQQVISASTRSKSVYFLMRGKMYAVEERAQNQPYIFAELYPVEIVGDFEIFSEAEYSYASIVAADFCECISMPSDLYLKWISQDAQALFYRTKLLMKQLGNQMSAGRQFFFMDHKTRCVSILFQYMMSEEDKAVKLPVTREVLAGKIGCSLRTCQRIIKELEEEDMIEIMKGKILIRPDQRKRMQAYLEGERQPL